MAIHAPICFFLLFLILYLSKIKIRLPQKICDLRQPFLVIGCSFQQPTFLFISVNNIVSSRSVGNHSDGESNLFFYKFNIFSAVLRQILIFFDSTDITFPSWQFLQNRFCFLKLYSSREICGNLTVNIICSTNRYLI